MTPKFSDDWGTALGSSKETYTPPPKSTRKPKKDSLRGLVHEFETQMLVGTPIMTLNTQINALALIKGFTKILESGKSYDDVRAMISQFAKDVKARPITDGTPLWRVFLGRLDSLAIKVGHFDKEYTYDDSPKIDPRLMENNND